MEAFSGKELTTLGTRPLFNKTLRHLVNVTAIIEQVQKGQNLAESLNQMVADGVITREQIPPILSVVLVHKFAWPYESRNLREPQESFDKIVSSFKDWNALNVVAAYHHPNLGIMLINPANAEHWNAVHDIKRDELMVVHASAKNEKPETARKAIAAFFDLLEGKEPQVDEDFKSKEVAPPPPPPPAPAAAAPAKKPSTKGKKLTPKYSVQVSNELFHNGNVEAWKNIIESFEATHEGCQVIVYHEGELIQDLNSLFKWGKVKHGGLIFFQVAGQNLKHISRLQKYLYEGASSRFEAFLKQDPNRMLQLF